MKPLILFAAVIAALLTVISTRLLIPALELVYYSILKTFEPQEPSVVPALAALSSTPVVVEEAHKPVAVMKPVAKTTATKTKATTTRTTRKRTVKPKTTEMTA